MSASINMGGFVMVAVILLIGVAVIANITSQSNVTSEAAPMHNTFGSIATMLNGGLGMFAIGVVILGFMIVLKVFDYI